MKKILSLFLVMIALLTCGVSVNAKESKKLSSAPAQDNTGVIYTKVTKSSELTEGDKVLITSYDGTKSLGYGNSQNEYIAIPITKTTNPNQIIGTKDTIELTYENAPLKTVKFKFPDGVTYLKHEGDKIDSWQLIGFYKGFKLDSLNDTALGFLEEYFMPIDRKKMKPFNGIDIYKRNDELVKPTVDFTTLQTKSSLVATLNSEKQALENVKLRLGGIIPKESFNSNNEYGVIALDSTNMGEIANLRSLTVEGLTALKNAKHALQIKKPQLVGDGYQFAWVINNIPEDKFGFEFYAVMYEVNGDTIKLSKCVVRSVKSTADEYVKKEAELNFEEDLMVAIKKLATK